MLAIRPLVVALALFHTSEGLDTKDDCRSAGVGGVMGAVVGAAVQFFAARQCAAVSEDWPRNSHVKNLSVWDFIVVGGGTAGSTVAARLAEDPRHKVLLIEAGPDPPADSIVPAYHATLMGGAFDWNYKSVGDEITSQALVRGSQLHPRGKMLGGSGSMNNMVYSRGFPADYDEWAETLGDHWNWSNVLPYFKKTEHLTDERIVDDPELMKLHGRDGEIEVAGFKKSTFETDQFLKAFEESGFKIVKDLTNPHEIGAGRHSHTIRDGRRDSSLTALLMKAQNKENLVVLKEAMVTKIVINNLIVNFVEVLIGGEMYVFSVMKEVIVSAGTFNTPKLLMWSGIGPKDFLLERNIPLVKNLSVGENLHDHVMVLNYVVADRGTCDTNTATSHMNTIKYLYDRSGPLSYINTMAAYMALPGSTNPNLPDFGFYPSCLPVRTPFYDPCRNILRLKDYICRQLQGLLRDSELITIAVVLMKPKSKGDVTLEGFDGLKPPVIFTGTFTDPDDLQGFPEAMKVVKKIAESSYFKGKNASLVDLNIPECRSMVDDEKAKCYAKAMAMSAWHSVGTAAMGSVVDDKLRVKDIRGLRVVDASVIPKVPRGNTNAPVIMIAEKAADFIKADYA